MSVYKKYTFQTDKFSVQAGEDTETNPGIFGKKLSEWICSRLNDLGYHVQPPLAEDWGWCVMYRDKPYMLWVGCSGEEVNQEIVWSYFIAIEKILFRNPFKKIDYKKDAEKIDLALKSIFSSEYIELKDDTISQ